MMKYPRVLIVNAQSMYKENATGITLQSLWGSWDANCLFEIYSDEAVTDSHERKIKSCSIPPNNILRFARGSAAQSINNGIKAESTEQNKLRKIRPFLRQFAVCTLDAFRLKLDNSMIRDIIEFQPQVIYTLGASISVMRLANKLSDQLDIPVVMHFMDNWAEHIQWEANPFLTTYKSNLRNQMMECLKRCKLVITISPSMAEAYQEKFQKDTLVLMNTVDTSNFTNLTEKSDGIIHFVYAGGLHLDRWKALKDIAYSISQTSGKGILDIYTSESNKKLYQAKFAALPVAFYKAIPHEQIEQVYRKADVLVHTENETEQLKGFFKYSISTKIPEYLATAKPILFYGPRDMKLFQYLSENQVALTASTKEDLSLCVKRLMSGESFLQMEKNARRLAEKNHDRFSNQKELRAAIEQICGK